MKTLIRDKKPLGAALLCGLLLFLSFPKFGSHAVAWFAFVPLFYALARARDFKEAISLSFISGMIFNLGIMYWIGIVVVKYGYLPVYVGVVAVLLFAAALAAYFTLFSAGVYLFRRAGIPEVFSAAPLWVCVEFAKSHLFTGFPWENLGYSQTGNIFLAQSADLFGVFGISFLIVFVNALLYCGIREMPNWKKAALYAGVGAALVSAAMAYGHWRLQDICNAVQGKPEFKVSLIQGNIDQSIKWNARFERESLDAFLKLTRDAPSPSPGLVIWPETATPFFFQDVDDKHREIAATVKGRNDYLILGSPSYRVKSGKETYMNSAFVVSNSGEVLGRYDKVRLVPFGEYVPLRKLLPFMANLLPGMSDFLPGPGFSPVPVGREKAGILICYESIFPEISRQYKRSGAGLLVNITNDAWFDRSSAPYQHLSMAAFRAIENRMYVARAANTGISAIIDPCGRVSVSTGLFERSTLQGHVKFIKVDTFYSDYGDWPVPVCFIMLAAGGAAAMIRRKKITMEKS